MVSRISFSVGKSLRRNGKVSLDFYVELVKNSCVTYNFRRPARVFVRPVFLGREFFFGASSINWKSKSRPSLIKLTFFFFLPPIRKIQIWSDWGYTGTDNKRIFLRSTQMNVEFVRKCLQMKVVWTQWPKVLKQMFF